MKRLRWGRRGRLGRRAGASAAVRAHRPGRRAVANPDPPDLPDGARGPKSVTRGSRLAQAGPRRTRAPRACITAEPDPPPMDHTRLTGHGIPSRKRGLKRKMAPWEDRSAPHPASDSQEPRNHAEVAERTRRAGANDPPRAPNLLRRRIRTVPATSAADNEHGKRVSEPRVVPVTPAASQRGAGPAGPARRPRDRRAPHDIPRARHLTREHVC